MPNLRPELPNCARQQRCLTLALLPLMTAASGLVAVPSAAALSFPSAVHAEALYSERIEETRARATEPEVRFMTAMLAHHEEGMKFIELAVDKGESSAVRTLAMRIRSNFEDESTMIELWLHDRHQTRGASVDSATPVADGKGFFDRVPGTLTPREMEELRQATGAEFDRLFLRHAIEHHETAVHLVNSLVASGDAFRDEAVFLIASSVRGEHAAYVAHMVRILAEARP